MNALIFGSNGQDGYYLTELLKNKGVTPIGISRHNADIIGQVQDYQLVQKVIFTHKPRYIFHFASNSTTRHDALWDNHDAISTGTFAILEAVKKYSPDTSVFLSGSGLQLENKGLPIHEKAPLTFGSPYVVSRNHSLFAARYYQKLGLNVYFGYLFNHDSPQRPKRHMAQMIAHYCRTIDRQTAKLEIGDISVRKEWAFAGDIVEAIWTLVNQDTISECVIGSGIAYSIEDWLNICFKKINKDWKEYVVLKPGFVPEYSQLVSDPSTITSLGWAPKTDIYTLADMMFSVS